MYSTISLTKDEALHLTKWKNEDVVGEDVLATKSPSSLSYTMAALNPAPCALLIFSSKLHPPRTINTNGD